MSNDLYISSYNPDVLSCIANLSNDEVFTPPEVANAMLNMLPQELFADPNATFLDPACKSGVFLREIAKRLLEGLKPVIPDLQERIDHIFQKQLFGIAITELTSLLARRSVYCSKYPNSIYSASRFDNVQGNIRYKNVQHRWKDGKCIFCGASEKEYGAEKRGDDLESHAYELIHTTKPEDIFKMKFDVIIGNPPYQMSDGGGTGKSAKPIYQLFVEQAKKLNPRYLTMIIPSRWFAGGKGLDDFRRTMLTDQRIRTIVDYDNFKEVFPGVDLAGGACYFLWDREHTGKCKVTNISGKRQNTMVRALDEFETFIRQNQAIEIVRKIQNFSNKRNLQPFSKVQSIAISSKPAHAVTGGDESKCLNDHLRQKCGSSAANFPQNRLHLRPHHLNRVQIRTVWRQIEWNHTRRTQCLFYTCDVVRPHVIHDYNVAPIKRRNQHVLQIVKETLPGCAARIHGVCGLTVQADGRQNGLGWRCVKRYAAMYPRFPNSTPISAGHVNVHAAFIQKHKVVVLSLQV